MYCYLLLIYRAYLYVCSKNVRDYNTCGEKKLYGNLESQSTLNKNHRLSHINQNPDFVNNFNYKEGILAK